MSIPQILDTWYSGNDNGITLLNTEGVTDEAYETPDRNHHEESDDSPEHNLLGIRFSFLVTLSEDKFDQSPEEGKKGNSYNDRKSKTHQVADRLNECLYVAKRLSKGKGRSKRQSGKNDFFQLFN